MKQPLSQMQIKILDALQSPLPLCRRPFQRLARGLNIPENKLLDELAYLKKHLFIRRFRAKIDYRALGRAATLAASVVPEDKIPALTEALNQLSGVSHNYLRDHSLNIWFTLQACSTGEITRILHSLNKRLGLEFFDFASVKTFKLDVRFNPAGPGADSLFAKCSYTPAVYLPPADLTGREKQILSLLNQDIQFVPAPFDDLAQKMPDCSAECFIDDLNTLCDKGVIRGIAAAVDHRKLGFKANAMFCLEVGEDMIDLVGQDLAGYRLVSHCYQRQTHPHWPYNVYAMLHGAMLSDLRNFAAHFAEDRHIDGFILLPTVRELKKSPVPYDMNFS